MGKGSTYTVERHEDGIIVRGEIPLGELKGLCAMAESLGFDEMYPGIAGSAGATMAISSAQRSDAWRAKLDAAARERSNGSVELAWLLGTDTGLSSRAIFGVLSADYGYQIDETDAPQDPDDFGRCYRLLKLMPGWRERLSEVADEFPHWAPLVRDWDQITALYELELPTGHAPRCYKLMRRLLDEGRVGR